MFKEELLTVLLRLKRDMRNTIDECVFTGEDTAFSTLEYIDDSLAELIERINLEGISE